MLKFCRLSMSILLATSVCFSPATSSRVFAQTTETGLKTSIALISQMETDLAQADNVQDVYSKLLQIESLYGVKISRERSRQECGSATDLETRCPRLDELDSLQIALERSSRRSLALLSTAVLEFRFLKTPRHLGKASDWDLNDGLPTITIEADYEKSQISLLELLLHELAHNTIHRMGFNPRRRLDWSDANRIGWFSYHNPDTGRKGWMLKSRECERYFYKPAVFSDNWIRCDRYGRALREDGQLVNGYGQAYAIDDSAVAETASVPPATDYFTSPMEMAAEAIMLLRSSACNRARLLFASSTLYEFAKQYDQRELDMDFGIGAKIRALDGTIVNADPVLLAQITSFEHGSSSLKLTSDTELLSGSQRSIARR